MENKKQMDATMFAAETLRFAAPTAMHIHVATIFVSMRTNTNVSKLNSPPSLSPIIPYAKNPKKNGGSILMGNKSKSSMLTKYASDPYTRLARSLLNRRRSSFQTGNDDNDINVKKSRMKKRLPSLFCMPPWLVPLCQKIPPTPSATAKDDKKWT